MVLLKILVVMNTKVRTPVPPPLGLSTTDFLGEKHCRKTEKLKRSAPAEAVQPLPNHPAPAEVCPAPVSAAEVCSSWTQKFSRRRNFYTINAPKGLGCYVCLLMSTVY